MKYPIAIAALAACWLTASTALAGVGEDTLNNDPVFQEQEARARARAEIESEQPHRSQEYNPEAPVAAGIKPSPPILPPQNGWANANEAERANERYNQELERYNNALAKWNQQQEGHSSAQRNDAAVSSPLEEWNRAALEAATERSRQAAIARYPECADPHSEFSKKCAEIFDRLKAQRNSLVYQTDAPERVADMASAELNQQFEAGFMASKNVARARYPQLGDPNSDLTKKYLEIQKRLTEERSPIMGYSNYPERIADMAAGELKIAPEP
jgi:hypothetical protein